MNDSALATNAVLRLLRSTVPERAQELDVLWRKYRPDVEIAPDSSGVEMNATRERIRFDNKTLRAIWLMGFSSWNCLAIYSPAILVSELLAVPIDKILDADDDRGILEADYRGWMSIASTLLSGSGSGDDVWPEGIPEPGANRDSLGTIELKATFDLVCMATAFIFLHEFRHVMYDRDEDRPASMPDEEASCDVWARSFITQRIGEYAHENAVEFNSVHDKRSMALAMGASVLYELTPVHARWGGTTHPPIADRIHSLVTGTGPSSMSNYWMFAACLMTGILRRENRSLSIVSMGSQELVEIMIEQLR